MVNIGIDFDGVITDPVSLKIKLAKEMLGLELTPEIVSKDKILNNGLDPETYDRVFRKIISSKRRYEIRTAPYAKQIIDRLYENHKIHVITSRHNNQIPYVEDWLKHKNIKYHVLINTSDQPKNKACLEHKIKIYLDDEVHKLEQITNKHTYLFLLAQPYNKDIEIKDRRIQRVHDWKKFYNKIRCLL